MNDQEINSLVARKLGWKDIKESQSSDSRFYGKKFGQRKEGLLDRFDFIPEYATDIKAAWEMLEQHIGDWNLIRQNGMFRCELFVPSYQQDGIADTAPMAICLAFLKLNPEETK